MYKSLCGGRERRRLVVVRRTGQVRSSYSWERGGGRSRKVKCCCTHEMQIETDDESALFFSSFYFCFSFGEQAWRNKPTSTQKYNRQSCLVGGFHRSEQQQQKTTTTRSTPLPRLEEVQQLGSWADCRACDRVGSTVSPFTCCESCVFLYTLPGFNREEEEGTDWKKWKGIKARSCSTRRTDGRREG